MTTADRRLVFLLNVAQRRLQRWLQARASAGGTTASQSGVLFFLGRRNGALMKEVGDALDLGPPALSGLVDRMVATNLIQRRVDPEDGRIWRLWLTPAGHKALARSKAGLAELNARLSEGFTEAEIAIVARWLASFPTKFPRGEDE